MESNLVSLSPKRPSSRFFARFWPTIKSARSTAVDFAAYLFVRLLVSLVQTLPYDMGDAMCRGIAKLAAGPLHIRKSTTDQNLAAVFPSANEADREQLSVAMWHHLLLMVCEIAWAQRRLHLTNWSEHVRFTNNRVILRTFLSQRPGVMVTGHFGNFEIGGYTMGLMGCGTTTIARKLDNRFLHNWVERFRSAKGQRIIDKEGCAPEVERHLSNGGVLTILADQHAGPKGCWVEFMGVPASCHKALALFSLSANAPMHAGYTRRINATPMQFESSCTAVADPLNDAQGNCSGVKSLTEWYNKQLAIAVDRSVEQYWWLHRRWRTPPAKVAQRMEKQRLKMQEAKRTAA